VLPGGPSSGFLGREELDLPLDADRLAAAGSSLGCAAVRVYAREACMACALREQLDFLAGACCGQCPPCRMETAMLVRLLDTVLAGGPPALLDKLDEVLDFAAGQGGRCSVISMPARPVRSALARFPADFAHHVKHGTCPPQTKEERRVGTAAPKAEVRI
jgi:NADH:ubiquinone oxidoreductase subunit F (NADH-binding)